MVNLDFAVGEPVRGPEHPTMGSPRPVHSNMYWALRNMDGPPDGPVAGSVDEGDLDACAICCESLSVGSAPVPYPCGHRFHSSCVSEYLSRANYHVKCPLCMQGDPVIDIAHNIIQNLRRELEDVQARLLDEMARPADPVVVSPSEDGYASSEGEPDPFDLPIDPPVLRRTSAMFAGIIRNLAPEFNA